ncbi:MAG: adenosylcobinamide-GDP ribazoletransferase [Candidatus Bathyarchaeota archaeon]
MFKGFNSLVAFLTIIPVKAGHNRLSEVADYLYLSPLVGAFIGFCAGLLAWFLLYAALPSLIVGVLTVALLFLITGLHHTDGLLDFGDGIMFQGSQNEKIKVMHDNQTGVGGWALGLIITLTVIFTISELSLSVIVQGLIVAEVSAKFSMVLAARVGRSAKEGINTPFVNVMHGRRGNLRLLVALILSLVISVSLLNITGLLCLIAGVAVSLIVVGFSNIHFNGVTGDVFGASNEFARMASLMTVLGVTLWIL